MIILFPSSIDNPKQVDEEYRLEYDTVKEFSELKPALFDYSNWYFNKQLKLNTDVAFENIIYRGWMFKPDEYQKFYHLLQARKADLITAPQQYNLMHEFPLVYSKVKEDTPFIETYSFNQKINIKKIISKFPRFLVKDYVKSVKNTSFPKYFDKNFSQTEFDNWMKVFYKYRGNLLTGGICIKEYVDLKKYTDNTNEWRVFYLKNEVLAVLKNSQYNLKVSKPPKKLINKYKNLSSPFYTVDYAELENGRWIIVETGDGGVSGLPESTDINDFYNEMDQIINNEN